MNTEAKHGTLTMYRYGCRCDECKVAKAKEKADYTARKKSGSFVPKNERKPRIKLCMPIILCMARDFGYTRIEIGEAFGCNGATITNRLNEIGYRLKEQRRKQIEREKVCRREEQLARTIARSKRRIERVVSRLEREHSKFNVRLKTLEDEKARIQRESNNLADWITRERNWYKSGLVDYEPQLATCKQCGKQWIFWPSHEKYGRHNPPMYCSKSCFNKFTKIAYRKKHGSSNTGHRLRRYGLGAAPRDSISLDEVIRRDNGICYICGCKVSKEDSWRDDHGYFVCGPTYPTRDHVIPISKGGTHTWDNVRLACKRCNELKGASVQGALHS